MMALFLVVLLFSATENAVQAQTASIFDSELIGLSITYSPTSPKAGDTVDLSLSAYSGNLNTAKITWYVDGIAKKEDVGAKTFDIQAKNNGEATEVRVTAESADGIVSDASTEIIPADLDLVIEPQSYTPPFYKGKALFANQGTVRLIALPNVFVAGKKASASSLTFRWQKDGTLLSDSSGRGANTLTVTGVVPIRDINITVSVFDDSGRQVAGASKILTTNDPKVLFYENSPLYGILYNKTVSDNYYLGGREELDIVAKPYFFDFAVDAGSDASYKWSVNGNAVPSSGKTNELLLKQTSPNLKGTATVSLSASNLVRIFQFADNSFNVAFGI